MNNVNSLEGKRVTLKRNRPNPLFEEWLEDLYEEAKAKKSKLESMLKEALESLSKYPLRLESGAECAVLKGFDKKLCAFLDKRIEASNFNSRLCNSDSPPPLSNSQNTVTPVLIQNDKTSYSSISSSSSVNENVDPLNQSNSSNNSSSNKKVSRARKYKPVFRSGGYAILVALLEHFNENPNSPGLSKEQLIDKAQQHSEESFVRPKPESYYTAWSNMTRLVSKSLVLQIRSRKTEYLLTDEGKSLALELLEEAKIRPNLNDIIFNGAPSSTAVCVPERAMSAQSSQESGISANENVELPAGSFDVILLIDKNETGGSNNKKDPTVAQFKKYSDLKHEYRSLKVGDFTWVARHKTNKGQELVLPYVVERKRMDDLGASIKDGRFHEQKFRLRKCGLPNVLYLVEHYGSNKHVGLPLQSLKQALANTRVQDGFKVHITDSLTNSVMFLAMMTKRLTIEYKDKHLIGSNSESQGDQLMVFNYFNKAAIKNKPLTVTEMFIKLLLQLKGVSVEKAIAITEVFKTPRSLIKEYEKISQKDGEMLLAGLKFGELDRSVGPSVSKAIYQFFVWREYRLS